MIKEASPLIVKGFLFLEQQPLDVRNKQIEFKNKDRDQMKSNDQRYDSYNHPSLQDTTIWIRSLNKSKEHPHHYQRDQEKEVTPHHFEILKPCFERNKTQHQRRKYHEEHDACKRLNFGERGKCNEYEGEQIFYQALDTSEDSLLRLSD